LPATDANAVLADCDLLNADDDAVWLLAAALEMSAYVLTIEKAQLATQLAGRAVAARRPHGHSNAAGDGDAADQRAVPAPQRLPHPQPSRGLLLRTLDGHTSFVNGSLALSDGRLLSWAWDNTLRLWDTHAYHQLAAFYSDAPTTCCTLLADGETIAAGDDVGRVLFLRYMAGAT
jgi:hypothetical protein